jgi:glutamate 5-kinase
MPAARKETSTAAVRPEWRDARRIVVKIGSALLVDHATGLLRTAWLNSIADDVQSLAAEGREIILVSSGAIALGRHVLKLPRGPLALEHSQAAASVGQISLSSAYQDAFKTRNLIAAQILLTLQDTEERRRYLNARQTMATLLARGAVPVVNENDTVATAEIRYGDNDRLSARVASMMSADCLVLLSDIDGLYTAPPAKDPNAQRLDVVHAITHEILAMAGDAGTELSKGGMVTKLEAARIAMGSGTDMVITEGGGLNPLRRLAEGAPCTWFLAPSDPVAARKRWIAGNLEPRGSIVVDAGAEKALGQGKSLLPAGVVRVEGTFDRGDAVTIRALDGRDLGRGLIAYPHDQAAAILGKRSNEIAAILGHAGRTELIHRDDMALSKALSKAGPEKERT